MTFILKYWKQLGIAVVALVFLSLCGIIHFKNATITEMSGTIRVKEAELALSNSSIYTLQQEIEKYNQRINDLVQTQLRKQQETDTKLQQLATEKVNLQTQMAHILATPETGNECQDVLGLLDNVGEQ